VSVLTDISEERELSAPPAPVVLPCINLLPPEIAERKAFRKMQLRLGSIVVVAAGLVGLVYVQVAGGVGPAQDRVDAAQSQSSVLQHQIAGLSNVTKTRAQFEASQAALAKVLGTDVRWSRYLNDLSISMPANVWVENLAVSQTATPTTRSSTSTGTATGTTTPSTGSSSNTVASGLGTLTIQGKALSFNDVAVWLDTLAKEKGYTNVWLGQGAKQVVGSQTVVNFTSTVTFTPAILSQRYTKQAGS
jgi:Tfp pilus assembly protein PilN